MRCYNIGNINATSYAGGIVGYNYGYINYSTNGTENLTGSYRGGIAGYCINSGVTSCYYLKNTTSINGRGKLHSSGNLNAGCIAQTVVTMPSIIDVVGNNFVEDTNNINNGYPILAWQVEKSE